LIFNLIHSQQTVSTIDIVNKALQRWKDCLIPTFCQL